ncbi:polytopic membrane protein [Aspergillus saccharolyticus JOP 1030-1]|uniref:Polytopic membrane protein n=1 Tax=Aspergillus saccharolyticus JOP 1030-1 TaxID=1450539 RepID=A0A319A4G8_9EURO|nr:polytopic membrane protein [Aspergillus saccharolyticus JOP 1030-1]PYH47038.1 polytopic membrane protein [Aspergillus saccharolyticus JOP 1030-1]
MAEDRSLAVRAVAAVFLALASVTTMLRCYVRLRIVKAFGWDDGIMVLAYLFYIFFSGAMIGGSLWGTGKHLVDLTNHQRTTAMEYWFYCDIGYAVGSILCKISVAIFILRITIDRIHRIVIFVVLAFVVTAGLAFFILLLVQCHPIAYFWLRLSTVEQGKGSCININIVMDSLYAFSATSALFDMTIAVLPILLVRKLKMHRDVKIAVASLLGMACVASVAVIARIPFIPTLRNEDWLYETVNIAIFSNIETGLGIFAGSMATLRPLLRQFRPSTYQHTWPSSSRGGQRSKSMPLQSTPREEDSRPIPLEDRLYGSTFFTVEAGNDGYFAGDQAPILPKQPQISVKREVHVTTV